MQTEEEIEENTRVNDVFTKHDAQCESPYNFGIRYDDDRNELTSPQL